MRNWFAAINEKWDFVTPEHAPDRIVIASKITQDHAAMAKAAALADVAQNLLCRQRGLGLGIRATRDAQRAFELTWLKFHGPRQLPIRLDVGQHGSIGEAVMLCSARQA